MVLFSYRMLKFGKKIEKKDKTKPRRVIKKVNRAKRDAKLRMLQDKAIEEEKEKEKTDQRKTNTQYLMEQFEKNAE